MGASAPVHDRTRVPEEGAGRRPARVLHVLPTDLARGAQRYARAVVDLLDEDATRHRLLGLWRSDEVVGLDATLDVPRGSVDLRLDPRVVTRLASLVRREPPDVVIAHGSEPLAYTAAAIRGRIPTVYYRIGIATPELLRNRARLAWYRLLGRSLDLVAGVSRETLVEVPTLLGRDIPTVLVPNGRDADAWPAADRPPTPPGEPLRLVWVGHLMDGKRPDLFVDVVRALREDGTAVDATLVGDGPLLDELRTSAPDVEVLGRRDDVGALMRSHDVVLATGDNVNEGMPGVLIEAGLSGRPVVTTDVAGADTVVVDRVTGRVVARGDRDALVAAVQELDADRGLVARLGDAARERCVEGFTLRASADRWRDVVDGLLGRTPVASAVPSGLLAVAPSATRRDGATLLVAARDPGTAPLLLRDHAAALYERLRDPVPRDDLLVAVADEHGTDPGTLGPVLDQLVAALDDRGLLRRPHG